MTSQAETSAQPSQPRFAPTPIDHTQFDTGLNAQMREWGITTLQVLQLTTVRQLGLLDQMGAVRAEQISRYLKPHRYGLRPKNEPFAMRAFRIYPTPHHIPVDALPLYVTSRRAPIVNIKGVVLGLHATRVETFGQLFAFYNNESFFTRTFGRDGGLWMRGLLSILFT